MGVSRRLEAVHPVGDRGGGPGEDAERQVASQEGVHQHLVEAAEVRALSSARADDGASDSHAAARREAIRICMHVSP